MALDRANFNAFPILQTNQTYKGAQSGPVYIVPDSSGNYNLNVDLDVNDCKGVQAGTATIEIQSGGTVTYDDASPTGEFQTSGNSKIGDITSYEDRFTFSVTFPDVPDDGTDIKLAWTDTCGKSHNITIGTAFDGVKGTYKYDALTTNNFNFWITICPFDPCSGSCIPTVYVDGVSIGYFDKDLQFVATHDDYQSGGDHTVSGYIKNPMEEYKGQVARIYLDFSPGLGSGETVTVECGSDVYEFTDYSQCCDYQIDFTNGGSVSVTTDIQITSILVQGVEVLTSPSGNLSSAADVVTFLDTLGLGSWSQSGFNDVNVSKLDVEIQSVTFTNDVGGTPTQETAGITQSNCN